jgi:predicted enzyme related to lactoylglutathione lyase
VLASRPRFFYGERMIKGVKFVNIPVRDQARALAFYTDKLGLAIATDQEMGPGGQRWIELRIPGAETRISLFTPPGHEDRVGTFVPLSLWSDDVDGTYETLKARGVSFLAPPKKEPWGTSVIFVDSEGNQLHLGSR